MKVFILSSLNAFISISCLNDLVRTPRMVLNRRIKITHHISDIGKAFPSFMIKYDSSCDFFYKYSLSDQGSFFQFQNC